MFLHSPCHDKRIGSIGFGPVYVTKNWKEWEEWYVESVAPSSDNEQVDENSYYIKSKSHQGKFLCSNSKGHVFTSTSAHEDSIWIMKNSDEFKKGVFLTSKKHSRQLACDGNSVYTVAHQWQGWETWVLEYYIGELCFMKSLSNNQLLSCDPFGKISFKDNSDGWEVFRFTDVGDEHGSVIISSWTHFPKCVCSSPQGDVWVGDNPGGTWEQWILEISKNGDGVLIRSKMHGKYLTRTDSDKLLTTSYVNKMSIWTFDSAHKNMFYLYNSAHKKFVVNTENNFLTDSESCNGATKWKIVPSDCTNEVALRNIVSHQWLSIADNGDVVSKQEKQWWTIKTSSHGGIILTSQFNGSKNLGYDGSEYYLCDHEGTWETWELRPILPQSTTKAQLLVPIVTTIGAVALAVATPFAIMGVVGMLGFGASGITAGSAAAGMMSAEAIAAGGGIAAGGVVATLQSIGAVGLGIMGTTAAAGAGAVVGGTVVGSSLILSGYMDKSMDTTSQEQISDKKGKQKKNRPICAWESW
jgi:Interferon-induced 6-16 family